MTVKAVTTLDGPLFEDAWDLYVDAFAELAAKAVQRHMATRDEFAAIMTDERWLKYLALDDAGQLVGLSTFTNHICVEVTPLLSAEFFAANYPEHYAEGRVWCIGFVAVHPTHWGLTIFATLIEEMWRHIDGTAAVTVFDMCRVNTATRGLPAKVTRLLRRLDGRVRAECPDEQTFFLHEYPA